MPEVNCDNSTAVELFLSGFDNPNQVNWDEMRQCAAPALSLILYSFFAACWGFFFLVTGIRRLRHSCSATRNMVVAKKLQHFQMWFYSFFYNSIYILSTFSAFSFLMNGRMIPFGFLTAFLLISNSVASTIDVLGEEHRKPGVNDVSFTVIIDYLMTTYLAKAVWKSSGHTEFDTSSKSETSTLQKINCLTRSISNTISPKVYDVKDVVIVQSTFLSLPAVFLFLFADIRADNSNEKKTFIMDVKNSNYEVTNILNVVTFSFLVSSVILSPLLGDYEAMKGNSKVKGVAVGSYSMLKRSIELSSRVLMYTVLLDVTKFAGLALMVLDVFFSYATYINTNMQSTAGRTFAPSHYLLSSIESAFFGSYARISVDKEFTTSSNMMSTTVEAIRAVFKTFTSVVAFSVIGAMGVRISDEEELGYMTLASGVASVLLLFMNVFEFGCVKRKELERSEVKRLGAYWKSWYLCSEVFCDKKVVHINRDNTAGHHMNGGIEYY